MKREIAIPIILEFFEVELNRRWLAEDDTVEGHVANTVKGANDHKTVMENILNDNHARGPE